MFQNFLCNTCVHGISTSKKGEQHPIYKIICWFFSIKIMFFFITYFHQQSGKHTTPGRGNCVSLLRRYYCSNSSHFYYCIYLGSFLSQVKSLLQYITCFKMYERCLLMTSTSLIQSFKTHRVPNCAINVTISLRKITDNYSIRGCARF